MSRRVLLPLILVASLACAGDPAGPGPSPEPVVPLPPPNSHALDGTWRAIYWLAQPAGQPLLDVWELGGRLDLTIDSGVVSGSMHLPADVTNGSPLTADMTGVVLVEGKTARFAQLEDTFVGRAQWSISDGALVLVEHAVEGTLFTVVLVRGW